MIVYGKQIVTSIIEKYPQKVKQVFLTKELEKKEFKKFMDLGVKIIKPDNKKAQSLARGGNHQGYLLEIDEFEFIDFHYLKKEKFILVLDGLTDVGNIGAIIRSAYALGVNGVIICGFKQIDMAPIIRTSAGAALEMPIAFAQNSADIANELKMVDFTLAGADAKGYDVKTVERSKSQKIALFLGSEGKGLSKKVQNKLDIKLSIHMENNFDSLNVSVAAGILIYSLQ
ncbi:MAG TPA: 23S rRNA (guanosine(2251)-2'-O)-methyltransferase RlmB [Arcobacter sp.]|nr:23S rRNA (guanosine(2251)-2'-O)-methyltransferase RlmB [Arcobacter sp.]